MFALPAPPPDGGFLVLNDAQIGNLDLVCAIKSAYPRTKIYAQKSLSREACYVMSIGNAPPGPSGMVGYFARQGDISLRAIRDAVDKLRASAR